MSVEGRRAAMKQEEVRRRTVKARRHVGVDSLDLTVPVRVCREHGVEPGDRFTVSARVEDGRLVIRYVRVGSA